ncbi:MAG: hypothetical protein ABIG34_02415 [Candidatus Peregrinibacteria bacterium]
MEREIPFLRQKKIFVFALSVLLFAIIAAFAPSMAHPFMSDDYHVLSALQTLPKDFSFFFTGNGKYLIPVTKLLWVGEWMLFGTREAGYHFTSLLLHIINTSLVILFVTRLLKSKWTGLLAGAFFALSASHWRTTMWMSAQMKLLAAFFLLLGLVCFLAYLRTGKGRYLGWTLVAQIGMPFSSALGVELPLVLALLYLFVQRTNGKRVRVPQKCVWKSLGVLLALALVYVVLQRLLYAHANAYLLSSGGIVQAFAHLPQAVRWLAAGLFEGLMRSSTGIFIGALPSIFTLHAAAVPFGIRLLPLGLLLILLFLPKRRHWGLPALLFAAWTLLLYVPPVLPDLSQGFIEEWFVTRARYFYLPAIPAAALLALLLTHVKLPKRRRPFLRVGVIAVLALFGATVLLSNLSRIHQLESYAATYTRDFGQVRDTYVGDLRILLSQTWGTQVVTIRDKLLGTVTGIDYAAHNVYPSHLAKVYLTADELASFRFLPDGFSADYGVTFDGSLWPPLYEEEYKKSGTDPQAGVPH